MKFPLSLGLGPSFSIFCFFHLDILAVQGGDLIFDFNFRASFSYEIEVDFFSNPAARQLIIEWCEAGRTSLDTTRLLLVEMAAGSVNMNAPSPDLLGN